MIVISSMFGEACLRQGLAVTTAAPEILAPGVISRPANNGSPTFTPDGNTLCFARSGALGIHPGSRKVNGQWTARPLHRFQGSGRARNRTFRRMAAGWFLYPHGRWRRRRAVIA